MVPEAIQPAAMPVNIIICNGKFYRAVRWVFHCIWHSHMKLTREPNSKGKGSLLWARYQMMKDAWMKYVALSILTNTLRRWFKPNNWLLSPLSSIFETVFRTNEEIAVVVPLFMPFSLFDFLLLCLLDRKILWLIPSSLDTWFSRTVEVSRFALLI